MAKCKWVATCSEYRNSLVCNTGRGCKLLRDNPTPKPSKTVRVKMFAVIKKGDVVSVDKYISATAIAMWEADRYAPCTILIDRKYLKIKGA